METWMDNCVGDTTHKACFAAGAAATAALAYYMRDLAPLAIAAGAVTVGYNAERVYGPSNKNAAAFGAMTVGVIACGFTLLRTLKSAGTPNFRDQLTRWIAPATGALMGGATLWRTYDQHTTSSINTWSEDMEKGQKTTIVAAVTLALAWVGKPAGVAAGAMLVTALNEDPQQEMTASSLAVVIIGTLISCDIMSRKPLGVEMISTNLLRVGVGTVGLWQLQNAIAKRDG